VDKGLTVDKEEEATRTTVGIADLPPGGRIAVELKVVAAAPDCNDQ